MKKIIIYITLSILICFFIPLIGVHKFEAEEVSTKEVQNTQAVEENNKEDESKKEYDYKEYGTIKLLHSSNNKVEEIKLDEYLYGVVSAEMPASYELEALKAQAIVARTYTVYKIKKRK